MVTMLDVARKAGASRTAVSAVLGGSTLENVRVARETRQRILDAARDLGYRPNELARAVALGRTRMIGYLIDEPRYEPYWNITVGALEAAEELGFTLKLLSVNPGTLADRVRQCMEFRLCGLVVRVGGDKRPVYDEASRARIPVVTVDESIPQQSGVRVASDDEVGVRSALDHLTGLSHRKIGFISSGFPLIWPRPDGSGDVGTTREALFRREMANRGLDLPESYLGRETTMVFGPGADGSVDDSSVRVVTRTLLSNQQGPPTAIFCWRDETAMLAIGECRRLGVRVPEEISIVGFSDVSAARLFDPPVSTVKMPWEQMGRSAIHQLIRRLNAPFDPSPEAELIPTMFVPRASSGPAPP